MNKKLLPALAAVLGVAAGSASAESNTTIYGFADAGLVFERGGVAGSVQRVSSGVSGPTRLGFKGTEELGGGLSAFYQLEMGVLLDTGAQLQPALFGRQAFVGLSSASMGSVRLGLQYTPLFATLRDVGDPFNNSLAGQAGNLMSAGAPPSTVPSGFPPAVAGGNTLLNKANTVMYLSPKWHGLSGELAYSPGEAAGAAGKSRTFGYAAAYASGALTVRYAFNASNSATGLDSSRNSLFGSNYDFGPLKAYFSLGRNKGFGSVDTTDALIGAVIARGQWRAIVSYVRKTDHAPAHNNASQIGVGGYYTLSKRTELYAAWAHIRNTVAPNNPAFYTVSNPGQASGSGNSAFNIGLRHFF